MDRLFFAIFPDADAAARAAELARGLKAKHRLNKSPLEQERLHITLELLGNFAGLPLRLIDEACDVAASLRWPAFDIELDHVISFKAAADHRRPLVLQGRECVAELKAFQHDLDMALKRAGVVRRRGSSFNPHLTLSYDKDVGAAVEVSPPIRWRATEFMLVHSFVGQSRYEMLGRWPLAPAPT
ncbi:MAG TPA: RNA 2',3'-cyclic phosphodiesterase [Candidatus Aquabacterium excrementipullorum]|nr:RNA 2',3'-cyclic phosphodiesterase [Candidatus Aquabacterium excrementipullorum]